MGADSRGWERHCVSSGSPRWGRCSRSACSPAAGSAGGSRSSWARRWEMSNSPHSSCLSPQRLAAPGGCRSCLVSSSCWTSSGCRMSTLPPCASRRNWTDSIKQCSVFPLPYHMVKKLTRHASLGAFQPWAPDRGSPPLSGCAAAHLRKGPHPSCSGALFPRFFCICMLNIQLITNRLTKCKHAKTTRPKQKSTLILSSTAGVCNHIQNTEPTLIPLSPPPLLFLCLARKSTSKTESKRTADSDSFSCSQRLLETWAEYFDFNKSKWAMWPCFIKGSSDWGKYALFAQPCRLFIYLFTE